MGYDIYGHPLYNFGGAKSASFFSAAAAANTKPFWLPNLEL